MSKIEVKKEIEKLDLEKLGFVRQNFDEPLIYIILTKLNRVIEAVNRLQEEK